MSIRAGLGHEATEAAVSDISFMCLCMCVDGEDNNKMIVKWVPFSSIIYVAC